MLAPPKEPRIVMNNKPALAIITGVLQALKALKSPTMEEVISITTVYNTGENRTPHRISRNGIDGSTPVTIGTRAVGGSVISDVCPSLTPYASPSVVCNNIIVNIRQTTTPNLRDTNEFNALIDGILTNDPIAPSISSRILSDELSDSSSGDLYSRCWMNFAADTGRPTAPQFIIHGLPTIGA